MDQTSNFCKIIDVYVYSELYKREIIKSKSFNFSNSLLDVQRKIMYILKSIVIHSIEEYKLESVFTQTFFKDNRLDFYISLETGLSRYINIGYIKNYLSG